MIEKLIEKNYWFKWLENDWGEWLENWLGKITGIMTEKNDWEDWEREAVNNAASLQKKKNRQISNHSKFRTLISRKKYLNHSSPFFFRNLWNFNVFKNSNRCWRYCDFSSPLSASLPRSLQKNRQLFHAHFCFPIRSKNRCTFSRLHRHPPSDHRRAIHYGNYPPHISSNDEQRSQSINHLRLRYFYYWFRGNPTYRNACWTMRPVMAARSFFPLPSHFVIIATESRTSPLLTMWEYLRRRVRFSARFSQSHDSSNRNSVAIVHAALNRVLGTWTHVRRTLEWRTRRELQIGDTSQH